MDESESLATIFPLQKFIRVWKTNLNKKHKFLPQTPFFAFVVFFHIFTFLLYVISNVHILSNKRTFLLYFISNIHFISDPKFLSPLQSKAFLTFEFIALRVLSTQSDPYQALMTIDTKHRNKTTESESENQIGGQQSKFYNMASGLTTSSPRLLAKSPPCHTKCTDV